MKKRGNRVLAGLLAVLVVLGAVPLQSMGAQYGIQKNKYLDVKKTPTGKTGQNMTISMIFDNSKGSEDLQGVSVRLAGGDPQNGFPTNSGWTRGTG